MEKKKKMKTESDIRFEIITRDRIIIFKVLLRELELYDDINISYNHIKEYINLLLDNEMRDLEIIEEKCNEI